MKTVCIYHGIDLDGWMSAAIVKHWWQENQGSYIQENNHITNPNTGEDSIDFISYNYGQPILDLSWYDKVIMVDISFPKEEMYRLWHIIDREIIWIDHHISAINANNNLIWKGLQDTNHAACELTWQYFFPNESIPEIVRLLGRYDCFGHKGTDEEQKVLEFQYGARMVINNYDKAYDFLTANINRGDSVCDSVHMDGATIYRFLCSDAKQSYKNGFPLNFLYPSNETKQHKIVKGICINKERFNPVNFGIDYHSEGYDIVWCFHYANGKWNFSIYNDNGTVDVSEIAKFYGGGGHKGAAGFTINDISIMRF